MLGTKVVCVACESQHRAHICGNVRNRVHWRKFVSKIIKPTPRKCFQDEKTVVPYPISRQTSSLSPPLASPLLRHALFPFQTSQPAYITDFTHHFWPQAPMMNVPYHVLDPFSYPLVRQQQPFHGEHPQLTGAQTIHWKWGPL